MKQKNNFLIGTIAAHEIRDLIKNENERRKGHGLELLSSDEIRKIKIKSIRNAKKKVLLMHKYLSENKKVKGYLNAGIEDVENKEQKKNEFKENLKFDDTKEINENNEETIEKIVNMYNKKYNENLKPNDILIIKNNPQFLGIDGNGNYINDYKAESDVNEYKVNGIGDVYVILYNDKIISSIGKVNYKVVNIISKKIEDIKDGKRKEFTEAKKMIDLSKTENGNDLQEKDMEKIFESLKNKFEKEQSKEKLEEAR